MSQNKFDYDVLYIGSGHGTFDGAIPLAAKGIKVGVVEAGLVGGTCPNRGCNAKISLDSPVTHQRYAESMQKIVTHPVHINWQENVQHKNTVIQNLPGAITGMLKNQGITILKGTGQFQDQHTVIVNEQAITAEKVVIATGLHPHRLDIPGTQLAHDSEDFMNLTHLPDNIAIIGSGYISMEFATMANAAGANVTVLMHGKQALRQFYQPFVQKIVDDLTQRGVKFITQADISAFRQEGQSLWIDYGQDQHLKTNWILDATGRVPNIEKLNLDKIGVAYNDNGIVVNDHLQTNVENIYASGDVIDKQQPKLTPTAIFESLYLTQLLSQATTDPIQYPVIPSVVFTSPRIAKAGMSVAAAQDNHFDIQTVDFDNDWYRQVNNEKIADSRLIFDNAHHLVGATEVSDQADNAMNTLLPAIEFQFGKAELSRLIYLFPSISSATWDQIK